MLIDIFARRYENQTIRDSFEQRDSRLLIQAFRILSEDMYPYYVNGKEDSSAVAFWTGLHKDMSRELGATELSRLWFTYSAKQKEQVHAQNRKYTMVTVCENWLTETISGSPDEHIKERLSLIELGFRRRENFINSISLSLSTDVEELLDSLTYPGAPTAEERKQKAL